MTVATYRMPQPGVAVILANGEFPRAEVAADYLRRSERIICCDGAADKLHGQGLEPLVVVGDMDSISPKTSARFSDRLVEDPSQDTNDLTKAIEWAAGRGIDCAVVLGADGKRLDHTIANVALIAEHCHVMGLTMLTDNGVLVPIRESTRFACSPGQQVSIFSLQGEARYRTRGLRYELPGRSLSRLWSGSLNEAVGDEFTIEFDGGRALVFLAAG